MKNKKIYVEVDGRSYEVVSPELKRSLRRAVQLPDATSPVDRTLYVVVTGESSDDRVPRGFVHLVTRDKAKAVRRLASVVRGLGFEDLKRGTNDGDEDADRRFDRNGEYALVNTFGCGLDFEAVIKEVAESDVERDICR